MFRIARFVSFFFFFFPPRCGVDGFIIFGHLWYCDVFSFIFFQCLLMDLPRSSSLLLLTIFYCHFFFWSSSRFERIFFSSLLFSSVWNNAFLFHLLLSLWGSLHSLLCAVPHSFQCSVVVFAGCSLFISVRACWDTFSLSSRRVLDRQLKHIGRGEITNNG